jgi:hypothetical protein
MPTSSRLPIVFLAALSGCSGPVSPVAPVTAQRATCDQPPVVASFAWIGGCREQKTDWKPATNPSSANVAELTQTFSDLAGLALPPQYFFFPGDLISGFDKAATLKGQLDAWATLYDDDPSGIAGLVDFVPIAGNHETLLKVTPPGGVAIELPNPDADAVWTQWIADNGFDLHAGNGPTADDPNADALVDDQSSMTYSFDDGDIHYVVLNTDTMTSTPDPAKGSTQTGWIAFNWLAADLDAAQSDPTIDHVFIFGHKPIVNPTGATDSDAAINPAFTSQLEQLLDGHDKVRGYLCSHAHLFDTRQLPGARGVWQIISGNGGSPLDATWKVPNPYFGFTVVNVYGDSRIGITHYARPAPTPYDSTMGVLPAQPRPELVIYP